MILIKPTDSAAQAAKWVKGRVAHHLRKEFPELLRLPSLWTPSYFVGSVGNVSTETLRYIESQTAK
jgi:putative transposase